MSNDTVIPVIETDEEIETRYLQVLKDAEAERQRQRQHRNAKARRYHGNHPEKRKLYNQRWAANNSDKKLATSQRRRARRRTLPDTWTGQDWKRCLDYWHNTCAVCGYPLRDVFDSVEPHADHWIPITYKGKDNPGTVPENMICLCSVCNFSKHNALPDKWLIRKFGADKAVKILKRIHAYFESVK